MVKLALDEYPNTQSEDFMDFLETYPKLDNFSTIFDYYSKSALYSKEAVDS
jgi:hypothetical protein